MKLPVLYQDGDILVVDKPAGMPTHAADPADPYPADALRVAQAQTGLSYLGMHQRLDADTSGVLLFSVRAEANQALAAAFQGREVHKLYLALVTGRLTQPEGVIDAAIVRDRDGRYRVTGATDPRGLAARTRYRVLSAWPVSDRTHREMTLLQVTPETGRSHQIRVHLAHIGCPVVGDPLYGAQTAGYFPRLCLHAWRLTLPRPTDGQSVTFTAPPPAPFARLLDGEADPALAQLRRPDRQSGRGRTGDLPLLRLALDRRAALVADECTTIYRLVNGAADGVPGLTVDRYGDVLVASVYDEGERAGAGPRPSAGDSVSAASGGTAVQDAAQRRARNARPYEEGLFRALAEMTGAATVYVKYRPRQASHLSVAEMERVAPADPVTGPAQTELTAREDGLAYLIRPAEGLSVGLFPDMREGRGRVRAWAAGARVLNTFAYTCGFGVAAVAGGAKRALNLDLSKPVLAWGQENYRANGFTPDPYDFVFGDVFDWLARLARRGEQFDLVILDPPGFSRTKTRRFSAAQDYGELAGLAARVTAREGLLYACCNVAELPRRAFRERVLGGLEEAGRKGEIAGVYREPALDFPVYPGAEPYLKMLAVRLN